MTTIPVFNVFVGEDVPIRYSFLSLIKSFLPTVQTLTGASISWTSQTPSLATYDVGSGALATSPEGTAEGITNDAVLGRFTMLAPGTCTVQCSVTAANPVATYMGVAQFVIQAVPTP